MINKEKQASIDRMVVLSQRLNQLVVEMQVRKAQLLSRVKGES